MALHLTAVILFMLHTHCMVHAPGRCVSHVVTFLSDKLSPEQYRVLSDYQTCVLQQLVATRQSDSGRQEGEEEAAGKLDNDVAAAGVVNTLDALKGLVFSAKKGSQAV